MRDSLQELHARIEDRSAKIVVVGLGYVGLPVACTFAAAGFTVTGIDIVEQRVQQVNSGVSPIGGDEPGLADLLREVVDKGKLVASSDFSVVALADVVTINVQTPVNSDQRPDYQALSAAVRSIGAYLKPGALVIVESTVSPGTTLGLVRSILEETRGAKEGAGFFLGACPERVMPGKLLANIKSVARVCGGSSPAVAEAMRAFYRHVVAAELDCTGVTAAELIKVVENTYRDVQIAFANEIALVCADLGVDVWKVRDLVNKVPYRDMHMPGGGVGGHCIPKDPWLLAAAVSSNLRLIPAARAVNDGMPIEIAKIVQAASEFLAQSRPADAKRKGRVLLMGLAYLPDSDDDRNSPTAAVAAELQRMGLEFVIHDPLVPGYQSDLNELIASSSIAVLMVPHTRYESLTPDVPFFVDARRLAEARQRLSELSLQPAHA
jgi:UDP-N-acetyl-D-mannosaminuronic acid dehydrogenase